MKIAQLLRGPARQLLAASVLGALLLPGCGSDQGPITSQTTKYQADDGSAPNSAPAATQPAPVAQPPADSLSAVAQAASTPDTNSTSIPAPPGGAAGATPPAPATGSGMGADAAPGSGGLVGSPALAAAPNGGPAVGGNPYRASGETPEELVASLQQLSAQQPTGTTRAAALADYQNVLRAVVEGAERLLEMPGDVQYHQLAAEYKVRALTTLAQLGDSEAPQQIDRFCAELKKNAAPELSRFGRRLDFANKLQAFASSQNADAQALLRDFRGLFADEAKDRNALDFGNQVASILEQTGFSAEATEVIRSVLEAFSNPDPSLAEHLAAIQERLHILESDVRGKMDLAMAGRPEGVTQVSESVAKLLAGQPLGELTLAMVRSMAQALESAQPELAKRIYTQLATAYGNHPNPELAKETKDSLDMFERRAAVLGQPFTVEGVTADGAAFDWQQYKGKVVLIDFWATWCQPCMQELPNIRRTHDQYRARGFEVVGVNLDDDPQSLQQFLSLRPLPWATVVSGDPNARGASHPLAVKCGVESIPFLVLVDRNGTAVAVNPPREQLDKQIEELLGPPAGS